MGYTKSNEFIICDDVLIKCISKNNIIDIPYGIKIIGENAFKGCVFIDYIYLPDTVVEIMSNAFKGCKKLKNIRISNSLVSVGDYAFHRCHSLEKVKLPLSVEELGNCAFLYCDNIREVYIPGVKKLGRQVFLNDTNLEKVFISNHIDISCIVDVFTGCSKLNKIYFSDNTFYEIENFIDILSEYDNSNIIVKSIIKDVYRMMEIDNGVINKFLINLKEIDICEGIKEIGRSCFFDKKGIFSVKFPKTLYKINERAFRNCSSLERIEFKNDYVEICDDAFKNCTSLKYIKLSDGSEYELKGIIDSYECINIPNIIKKIYKQVLGNFIISGTSLIKYIGIEERVIVPQGVETISENAFSKNETIIKIILPNTVKIIEDEAFSDCVLLQRITLSENINYIGKSAFENCVKLLKIELPKNIDIINKSTFSRCKSLYDVVMSDNIKIIDDMAFYKCDKLKNIFFNSSLEYIGELSFYMCKSLHNVCIPKRVTTLGNSSFSMSGVVVADIHCKVTGRDVFAHCKNLEIINFHYGVEDIGINFAYKCYNLCDVYLSETIKYIKRNAFLGTKFLNDIELNTEGLKIKNNIIFNAQNCYGNLVINDNIHIIAGGVFYKNNNILSVDFGNSFKYLNDYTFCECKNLKSVILPKDIEEIPEGFFEGCNNLSEVFIKDDNDNIKVIRENAFANCYKLDKIFSLKSIREVNKNSFKNCNLLFGNININNKFLIFDNLNYDEQFFNFNKKFKFITVLNCIVDGTRCENELYIPEGITSIGDYSFFKNQNITKVIFPESLLYIGECAFYDCKNLEDIKFNKNLKYIGKEAFSRCISLKKVDLNIDCINEGTFSWCINIENVVIDNVKKIGKNSFMGCNSIKNFEFGNVEIIEHEAFSFCHGICELDLTRVKIIFEKSFFDCINVEKVILSDSSIIYSRAFENCCSLHTIEIKGYCKNLVFRSYAFTGCTYLKQIIDYENKYIIDGINFLKNESYNSHVKHIYSSALTCFYINENDVLESYYSYGNKVNIPYGVVAISSDVFRNHTNIEYINIPDTVRYIGNRAFDNTLWLENQKKNNNFVIVNNMLVNGSLSNGDVYIPKDIYLICGWAFSNGYGIKRVIFKSDEKYIKIDDYAFRNCINLESIILKNGDRYDLSSVNDLNRNDIPLIIKNIFNQSYNCFKTDENGILYESTKNMDKMKLPKDIKQVGEGVFKESHLLTEIELTNQITVLNNESFYKCDLLKSVKYNSNVEIIGDKTFSGCIRLEYFDKFEKLYMIGKKAFENCTNLKMIYLPEGIKEIPERAFFRCKSLEEIVIPSTVTTIGKEAFAYCDNLKNIVWKSDKTFIDIKERAFIWCGFENIEDM